MIDLAMIAAFPPPISGQSLATKLLQDGLPADGYRMFPLNLAETIGGDPVMMRLLRLAGVEANLVRLCLTHPGLLVYLQLGHGKMSLIRDLVFMATAITFRKPCVVHVHGSGMRKALDSLPVPLRWLDSAVIGRMDAAIVLSKSLTQMFSGILDPLKVHVVDNGIDPDFVRMTDEAETRSFSGESLNVLFLSNFLSAKGFSTLLRTAVMAQEAHKPWQFMFVGQKVDGQDVNIDEFIQEYGLANVTVHGVVEGQEKHRAYQQADVFILPSSYEGQPLCILEAMFEGLPVITTRVGGIPEIFQPDDACVVYVEPNQPGQIFDALESISKDTDRMMSMSRSARELAVSRFTAEAHVQAMTRVFEDVVAKDR